MRRAREGGGTRDARRSDGRRRLDAREDAGGGRELDARGDAREVSSVRVGARKGKRDARGWSETRARFEREGAKGLNAARERWRESGNARVMKGVGVRMCVDDD